MSYTPQPGTIPAKVIARLRLTPKERITNAVMADSLDIMPGAIETAMCPAVRAGLVRCRKAGGAVFWWLGDGVPLEVEVDEPEEQPAPPVVVMPPRPVSIFNLACA